MIFIDSFYTDGKWRAAGERPQHMLFNPATEEAYGKVALGTAQDVDRAVEAASRAFPAFASTTVEERTALLRAMLDIYARRYEEFVAAITLEMGAPVRLSRAAQAATGIDHLNATIEALMSAEPVLLRGNATIHREPVGVCALITPWNWPISQIMAKVAPALAAGCTMVLKPSELTPLSAQLLAEVLDEAGVPAGVFNMVHGTGPAVGAALASHPGIDMVSFTGSTAAGVEVAIRAAPTVKRVCQELGGKSANILLPDVDFAREVPLAVGMCMDNTGQSCNAPTRLLVPRERHDEALEIAAAAAEALKVGDPRDDETDIGPLVSRLHMSRVQTLIDTGLREGATRVTGHNRRKPLPEAGYFVAPTIFGNVAPDMTIAQEEIFGPVLSVIPYRDEEDAIRIANGTRYGLAAYVSSADAARACAVAARLRAGNVHINGGALGADVPFGGYRQSGNGREQGSFGLEEFTEVKAVLHP